ncbi:Hypothetical predicted protein [Marmota monax]|uniref:ABC transporter family G domain-containing protein n=1 Tax=Marmota monax TaxID=9995 RepID=A0A5E4BT62_MARMO|nr:Hypothetical predicted protein [Marmota monax]
MELIMDPPILFLDEPTAGLDSSTASTVLLFLKSISEQGRTIIFTIHQPRYSVFKLFDSLTLLASGKLMYHGPAQKALEYFQSAGYQCEPYSNPAYFFLDVINRDSSAIVLNRKEEDCDANGAEQFSKREKPVVDTLAEFYANSSFYRNTKARLQELSDCQKRSSGFKEITHVSSFCHQFRWILWHAFRNYLGFPSVTIPQVILGMTLNFGTTTPWLSWIEYLSIPHYGYMCVAQNQCQATGENKVDGGKWDQIRRSHQRLQDHMGSSSQEERQSSSYNKEKP